MKQSDHNLAQVVLHSIVGKYTEAQCRGEQVIQEDVYVIKDLHIALLSRPASVKLNLIFRLDSMDKRVMAESYPKLCQGLGMLQPAIYNQTQARCYSLLPYNTKTCPDSFTQ